MCPGDTWFHIPEKFPLKDQISRKTVFLGYPVCAQPTGHRKCFAMLHSFHPLVDIPQIYPSWVTFAEGCTVFQLSTSDSHPLPQYQQWRYLDGDTVATPGERWDTLSRPIIFFKHHSPRGATIGYAIRIADMHWCTNSMHIF